MKYLITGGCGFIGSHLADTLIQRDCEVMVIDNLSTGSFENIKHLKKHPQFEYVIDTITDVHLMAELVDQADAIFHLAASVGVKLIVKNPVSTIETNVWGTEVLLRHAAKKKKKVLIASTSEVYGKSDAIPFKECGDSVIGPPNISRWSYAASKSLDEFLGFAYYKEYGVPIIITRLFNTVGSRQTGKYGMVVPRFIKQALSNMDITVTGDGKQSRCFCWVGDTVDALTTLINHQQAIGRVWNVGNNEEITIYELAEVVKSVTKSKSKITLVSYTDIYGEEIEDMQRRVPDISNMYHYFGWKPTKNIREIIECILKSSVS